MNNAELLVAMLETAGVRWVFGVPSGPVLPFMDALRRSSIEFVLTASETSAGFMATTVGHLTGTPGVCVATVGPGATNLATGVGAAWLDRAPVLAISCNVGTPWLDRRIQMRIDHQRLFQPLTKATFGLRSAGFAENVAAALLISRQEPPGPVHLDLPEDVSLAPAAEGSTAPQTMPAGVSAPVNISPVVADALARASRPLVITGLSFTRSHATSALVQLVERHNLPFVTTMHGKGWMPESHPNWCGVIGRARRSTVQSLVDRSDLILAVGYDPIEINYEEWVGGTPVIHLSTEAADNGGAVTFLANAEVNIDQAVQSLLTIPTSENNWLPSDFTAHRDRLEADLRPASEGLALHQTLDLLRLFIPAEGILTVDVGAHTHQVATQWRTDVPDTCLGTNGWSSMGFGMPAAYAAKLIHPDRPVVAVVGDGGFQMTAGELALARRLQLSVPTIVLNDGWLGLMKVKQERRGYPYYGVDLGPSWPPPAHYFGVPCRPVESREDFVEACDWAFALNGPSVIEVRTDPEPYSHSVYD